ncbi:MAG: GNAT family N-acetyltransferase [Actinomycetota bacterium]
MVRSATTEDLAALRVLYGQLHPEDPVVDLGRVFATIEAQPGLDVLVLDADGRVAATAYLNVIPNLTRSLRPYGVVENVVVDEGLRRTGLGRRLIEGTLERAWALGCYKVMLSTGSRQASTHAFYRACGFSAEDKTAYVARPPR